LYLKKEKGNDRGPIGLNLVANVLVNSSTSFYEQLAFFSSNQQDTVHPRIVP
jgi:hypothetical protein